MGRYKSNSGDAEYLEEAKEQVALENARVNRPLGLWFVKHWSPKAAVLSVRITDHTDYIAIAWEIGTGHSHAKFTHLVHYMINSNSFKSEATHALKASSVLSVKEYELTEQTVNLWERFI